MAREAENQKIDEVLKEILAGQIDASTYKFAAYTKGFYDNFLKVGFSEPMAREMVPRLRSILRKFIFPPAVSIVTLP